MKKLLVLAFAFAATLSACNNQEEVNPAKPTKNIEANLRTNANYEFDEVEVQVQAVDDNGNVIYSDYGYQFDPIAYNVTTGKYVYPDPVPGQQHGGDTFYLEPGTYRFDSRDGYFSGTSSKTVQITGDKEYVLVQLNYWSE
jgi:hypothetical protein